MADVYRIAITIPSSSAGEGLTDFPLPINLANIPSVFWSHLYYDSGADIRIKNSSGALIPFDLLYIHRESQIGLIFTKITLNSSTDTVIYIYYGDSTLLLLDYNDANGRNNVWTDYHRVFLWGDYLYDRTGSGERLNYTSTYNYQLSYEILSPDTTCHQGCAFDGTYYYTINNNLLRKYDSSWNIVASNIDPCGDAGGGVTHCGSGFVRNGILYTAQTTAEYAVTQLAEFNTNDLSYRMKRTMSAPGGVYWTAGVTYVHEWDQFVFCEYNNDGTKLFIHNNDTELTYVGSISLSIPLTQMQGISYWRGAFWISRDANNYLYRVNRDGTEATVMGYLYEYDLIEGVSNYDDKLYIIGSNSSSHGVILRWSLPTAIDNTKLGLYLPDPTTPTHRAVIYSDRFTQWTIGIGQQLAYRKSYQNHVIGYGLSTATDNAKRESLTWYNLYDRFTLYNSSDGLLTRDPLSSTATCDYKTAFALDTVDAAPAGWTERWNTTTGAINIRNDGVFGNNCLETTATSSARYAASIDALGTVTNCEILSLVRITGEYDNICRLHARGGGATGSENTYWAYCQASSNTIGIHKYVAGVSTSVGSTAKTIDANTWYYMRFRVVGTSLQLRVWEKGTTEPVAWDIDTTDSSLSSGWIGVGRSSVNTQAVDYDYFAVSTQSTPITVPLPVTDIGGYARLHIVHDGTTQRTMYYNNTAYVDTPSAERPSSDADALLIGYNDADNQYGTDGYLTYLYLRNSILSENWIIAENNSLNDPTNFYSYGGEEYLIETYQFKIDYGKLHIYAKTVKIIDCDELTGKVNLEFPDGIILQQK